MNGHEPTQPVAALSSAKLELYHAEVALHDAELSCVDAWIKAAADHLHRACVEYERQLSIAS